MRKVKLQMQLSLDGFVAGENGELDWATFNWSEDIIQYVTQITTPVDCIILGHGLAKGFIPHWAAAANTPESDIFAKKMYETPKVVFSKTLATSDWENVHVGRDIVADITALKQAEGSDIIVYGGGGLVSNLIAADLIDEYHLFINPVILGKGMSIFQSLENKMALNLIHSQSFDCGINVLFYKPITRP